METCLCRIYSQGVSLKGKAALCVIIGVSGICEVLIHTHDFYLERFLFVICCFE